MPAAAAHVAGEHRSRGTEQRPKVSLHTAPSKHAECVTYHLLLRTTGGGEGQLLKSVEAMTAHNNKPPPGLQLYSPRPEAGAGVRGAGVAPAQPGLPAVVTP